MKTKMFAFVASIGLTAAALTWSPVGNAAIITAYTDATTWASAAGTPIATEDFTDTTLVPGLSVSLAGGGAITGGEISSSLAVFGLCIGGGVGCPSTTEFSFSPGTTAFGADWDLGPDGPGAGIDFLVTLAGGGTQFVSGITNPLTGGTFNGFFGFVSDTSFTSISLGSGFTGNGETFDADNVKFVGDGPQCGLPGQPACPAPEPETFFLIGLGLISLAISLRRKLK